MRRPDRWYIVRTQDSYLVFKKYRHLKEYVADAVGVPYEELLDVTLDHLKLLVEVTRVKVKLNRKGELMEILGEVYNTLPLTALTYED